MNFLPRSLAFNGDTSAAPSLRVVVAYEDFATGTHALRVFEHLFPGGKPQPGCFTTQNVWKFDLLGIAKFRDLAAIEAACADMVIVSAHAPGELPTPVRRWMEMWIETRAESPGALVVLLDDTDKISIHRVRAEAYFQACAYRAGMDYFIQRTPGLHMRNEAGPAKETWDAGRVLVPASGKTLSGRGGLPPAGL